MFPAVKNQKFGYGVVMMLIATVMLSACGDATNTVAPAPVAKTSAAAQVTTAAATTAALSASIAAATSTTSAAQATTAAGTRATTAVNGTDASAATTPANGYKVAASVNLSGSGASYPDKAYQKWIATFASANPSVKLSYKSVGSGAGRKSFFANEVDFAGSDAYPSKTETETYGKPIVTIPTTIGGVTVSYNLPGVTGLKLSPEILGGMYTGKITKWSDEKIKAENTGLTLPDTAISFAVRADSSGTSDIYSKYLAEVSPEFKALGIAGSQPEWGKGGIQVTKGEQNPGVATAIKQNVGMLGYVDYGDAVAQNLNFAAIKNSAGDYVAPKPDNFALAEPKSIPDNLQISVVNSPAKGAYPITATSWVILPKEMADKGKAEALLTWLWWVTHDTQQLAAAKELGFAPLPSAVIPKIETALKSVTAGGATVLK